MGVDIQAHVPETMKSQVRLWRAHSLRRGPEKGTRGPEAMLAGTCWLRTVGADSTPSLLGCAAASVSHDGNGEVLLHSHLAVGIKS